MTGSIRGCLLGGAVGDALGAPIEFFSVQNILDKYGPKGLREYRAEYGRRGAITDDTQMALFTSEGILLALESHPAATNADICLFVHRAYLRWLSTQSRASTVHAAEGWLLSEPELHAARAPGNTCISALRTGRAGTVDRPINDSKGCGTVMRVAPAGLALADPRAAFDLGVRISAITHGHPTGYLAGGALASIVSDIMRGQTLRDAIDLALDVLNEHRDGAEVIGAIHKARDLAAAGSPSRERLATLGEGWVAEEALAIALYCALSHERDVEECIALAVNHAGDSDSTGSIAGSLVGLINGPDAIPQRWLAELRLRGVIEDMAGRLEKLRSGLKVELRTVN